MIDSKLFGPFDSKEDAIKYIEIVLLDNGLKPMMAFPVEVKAINNSYQFKIDREYMNETIKRMRERMAKKFK